MLFEYTIANGYRRIDDYLAEPFDKAEDFDHFLESCGFYKGDIAFVGNCGAACIALYEACAPDKVRHGFMIELRICNTQHFYVMPHIHDALHFIKEHRKTIESINNHKDLNF